MPSVVIPDARLEAPELLIPGRKPAGPMRACGDHLGVEVEHFYMLGGSSVDLVTGHRASYVDSTPNIWTTSYGSAIGQCAQTNENSESVWPGTTIDLYEGFFASATLPTTWIIHLEHSYAGSAPSRVLDITSYSWNQHGIWISMWDEFGFRVGTFQDGSNTTLDLSGYYYDHPVAFVVHYNPATKFCCISADGKTATSSTIENWVTSPNGGDSRLFGVWANWLDGKIWSAAKMLGSLSEEQCRSLSLDPYQLLTPA